MIGIECIFCEKFSSAPASIANREWYDKPIIENESFLAIPALGQLVPGYLQIISRKHVLSMALLFQNEIQDLWNFCEEVIKFQSHTWGPVVIFEHGVCKEDKPTGACINHAHWHLVPGGYELLPDNQDFMQIDSFAAYAKNKKAHSQYLYYADQNRNEFILENANVPGQFFRRILASRIGKPDEWDYLVFPFFENIQVTYDHISQYMKTC